MAAPKSNYGIDPEQLRLYVIRPALHALGVDGQMSAENLVLGTALQESGGKFVAQVGGGPALGLWQMEPATHDDIYMHLTAKLRAKLNGLRTEDMITEGPQELVGNLYYAAAMCRLHYLRVREALPQYKDAEGMARYYKRYYNTPKGKATVAQALPHFAVACA